MKEATETQASVKNIAEYKKHNKFLVAVDCIIFGFDGMQIKALFVKRAFEPGLGKWSLMGGFVNSDEGVEEAAVRILNQLTGLTNIYMEQLSCFGEVNRDPAGRVISISYYALINIAEYTKEMMQEHNARWFELTKIPHLIFDHAKMVDLAKERLRQKVANHPIGFALLPQKFTLKQLQNLYEAVYETPIDKRNFTRKILNFGFLQKLNEKQKDTSKKGSFYYVFDEKKYKKLDQEGIQLI